MERRKGVAPISTNDNVSYDNSDGDIKRSQRRELRYSNLMLLALCPSLGIIASFGGKPTLIAASFGAIIAYIFDLVGTIEGTMLTAGVGLFAIWAILVWVARLLLQDSLLYLSLVGMFGVHLLYLFVIFASHFKVILAELDSAFWIFETFMFATTPLLSASILSWFFCVEIPAFDLSLTFAFFYFAFVLWLCGPRTTSEPINIPTDVSFRSIQHTTYVLNLSVMKGVYAMPVLICPILYAATAHNVLLSSPTHIMEFALSILWPLALMLFCAQKHIQYWPVSEAGQVSGVLGTLFQLTAVSLFFCLQTNPIFDDIKSFAGIPEPLASATVCAIGALGCIALYIRRSYEGSIIGKTDSEEASFVSAAEKANKILFVTICLGLASILVGYMLRLPAIIIVLQVGGTMAMAEFYQRRWAGGPSGVQWTGLLLILLGSCTAGLVAICFTKETLYYMNFTIHFHTEWTVQEFCEIFSLMISVAILLPPLAYGAGSDGSIKLFNRHEDATDYTLPGSYSTSSTGLLHKIGSSASSEAVRSVKSGFFGVVSSTLFSFGFPIIAIVSASVEVMIREQDWKEYGVDSVDGVYPMLLFLATAVVMVLASIHLYRIDIANLSSSWIVSIVQITKLLHLFGVNSLQLSAIAMLLLSFGMPIVSHYNTAQDMTEDFDINAYFVPATNLEMINYLLGSAGTVVWASRHLAMPIFVYLVQHEPSLPQYLASCFSVLFGYDMILLVLLKSDWMLVRSLVFLLFLVFTLVATDAFGTVDVTLDPSSPAYLAVTLNPDMLTTDRSGLFAVLATLLGLSAAFNLVPIRRPVPRLLFTLAFSYSFGRALLSWAFPLSLSTDSATHGIMKLPSMFCFISSLLATSTILHSSQSITSTAGGWIFLCNVSSSVLALFWAMIEDTLLENALGIVWASAVTNGCIAVSTRFSDIVREVGELHVESAAIGRKSTRSFNSVAASVAVIAACLSITWIAIGSVLSPHIYTDLAVPAASLLLLCTKRGMIGEFPPLALSCALSATYLILSALYSIFLAHATDEFFVSPSTWYEDGAVSIWNAPNWWSPYLSLLLALLPIPAVVLAILRRKEEAEETMFLLAILGLASTIGGEILSVKLLGFIGTLCGFWRVYDIGLKHSQSVRLI